MAKIMKCKICKGEASLRAVYVWRCPMGHILLSTDRCLRIEKHT